MKKTTMIWGILALGAMLIGGQVAQACGGGGGQQGPRPTQPQPTPEAPYGS